jgi:Uncharacterized conserved protein (COG2071)
VIIDRIDGTIQRRLLVNYRIDPDVAATQLPHPFRPQIVAGWAVAGVCFIRLAATRPHGLPHRIGLTTENVAHRFAVEYDDQDGNHRGVYIPRRDTNSLLTSLAGDRIFPGQHHLARFHVHEERAGIQINVLSRDRHVQLDVQAHPDSRIHSQLFASVHLAADFFRQGSVGWSPSSRRADLDAVRLGSHRWDVQPLGVDHMTSSLFDNHDLFPPGSATLDCALLMKNLPVSWIAQIPLTQSR